MHDMKMAESVYFALLALCLVLALTTAIILQLYSACCLPLRNRIPNYDGK